MMTWSSQAFDASSAFPFQLCESCNAQPVLEPAWQRPACLLEVAQLRRIDDVFEFLRQELRVPIPLCASANSDPCLKRLRAFFFRDRLALDRCLVGIWNKSFMSKGILTVEDSERLLEEAKADSRLSFTTKQQWARKPQGRLTTNKDESDVDSVNTSFSTEPSITSPLTSLSSMNGLISPLKSLSEISNNGDTGIYDWQKVRVAQRTLDVHEISRKPAPRKAIGPIAANIARRQAEAELDSRPLENHVVSSIPEAGLFVNDLPPSLLKTSSSLRWELTRIALAYDVPLHDLASSLPVRDDGYDALWPQMVETAGRLRREHVALASKKFVPPLQTRNNAWTAADESPNVIRTGKLCFRSKGSPLAFKLLLSPLKLEVKSCRFARRSGAHRFLYLTIPSLQNAKLPDYLSGQTTNLRQRLQQWLLVPEKQLMGYSWTVFCTRAAKTTKKANKRGDAEDLGGYMVVLFATKGYGLQAVEVGDILNWFMPLHLNLESPVCKAFARIDLGFSKTYPTIVFRPNQICKVADHFSDGAPEDPTFNDESLVWVESDVKESRVMNDGCSRISSAAAQQIWECLKQPGYIPSAFQARLGPYKGVWMVSPGKEIWIEVSDSQRKFRPHNEDLKDDTFDPQRLTFEVNTWPRKLTPSVLYRDYLPILEDRGVSKTVLEIFLVNLSKQEKQKLELAISERNQSYKWLQDNFLANSDHVVESKAARDTAPSGLAPTMKLLLEGGFEVNKLPYLSQQFQSLASWHLSQLSGSLNVELNRSTMVMGIADPIGCLQPNEIHLAFSSSFTDATSGSAYNFLHGSEALVARHPSLRRSDIQKVRTTFKMELRHLLDVVVFPRTGTYPLAGKLQGGDYDGDTFWVCWEPALVEPFRNAPMPLHTKKPEQLGIKVDRTTVGNVAERKNSLVQFFKKSFEFAWQSSYLGISTNFHTKLCYSQNSVSTKEAEAVADVHDYLVDSAKNGYTFDDAAWEHFRKSLRHKPAKLLDPAYKTASEMDLLRCRDDRTVRHNPKHVIDYLVFRVARRDAREILVSIKDKLKASCRCEDEDISKPWLAYASRPDLAAEVRRLGDQLNEVYQKWPRWTSVDEKIEPDRRKLFTEAKLVCREMYLKIAPLACLQHDARARAGSLPNAPSMGDLVKASAAFHLFCAKGSFVFAIAAYHIQYLKACAQGVPYFCVPEIFEKLKMRKPGGLAVVEQTGHEEEATSEFEAVGVNEEGSDSDEFYDAVMDVDDAR